MKTAIIMLTDEEKEKAIECANKIIDIIEETTEESLFKAYILQMLLESFEETHNINIKQGISISKKRGE